MDTRVFKAFFSDAAKRNGFTKAFGGWIDESPECITALDLQKSNFGDYYELNIKSFVQGMFGKSYATSKDLVKVQNGDVFVRPPVAYRDVFDLDDPMDRAERERRIDALFSEYIPLTTGKNTFQKETDLRFIRRAEETFSEAFSYVLGLEFAEQQNIPLAKKYVNKILEQLVQDEFYQDIPKAIDWLIQNGLQKGFDLYMKSPRKFMQAIKGLAPSQRSQ